MIYNVHSMKELLQLTDVPYLIIQWQCNITRLQDDLMLLPGAPHQQSITNHSDCYLEKLCQAAIIRQYLLYTIYHYYNRNET